MNEFKSWLSYEHFERDTIKKCRYVFSRRVQRFLDTVLETTKDKINSVPKGEIYWRSQLGNDWRPIPGKEHYNIALEPCPYPSKRMKPLPHQAKEGRANPKGIPYLYVASDKETSMAEVRPGLNSKISVGKLEVEQDIILVDCSSLNERKQFIYIDEPSAEKKEETVWTNINWAFSRPVTTNDNTADYIPTQILAELFKVNGFDGIKYKSEVGKGFNIVLFDCEIAKVIDRYLFRVDAINYSFKEATNLYSSYK